jgi:putative tricarboxylic transport membrane protein
MRTAIKKMRSDKLSSAVWLILGAVVVYYSKKMGLGILSNPGPGFLPFWAGVILIGFSIFIFFQDKIASQEEQKSIGQLWAGMNWSKCIILILGLSVYTLIFSYIGFLASTTALLLLLLKTIDPMGWKEAIGESLVASFISFAIFDLWLKVQLPRGFIERFLF